MKEKIILIICIAFMLIFPITLASSPQIDLSPENETWVNNDPQEVNITVDAEKCKYSYAETSWDNKENMSILEEDKFNASVNLDEETNKIYFQCNKTEGELTDNISYILKLDQQPPEAGSITINDGEKYTTSDSVELAWEDFSDEHSGIEYYYYNHTDAGEEEKVDNSKTQVQVDDLDEGNITFNVWAEDKAGNTGEAVSSWVVIDQTPPQFEGWSYSPEELRYNYDDSLDINFTVVEKNLADSPVCRYKLEEDYSGWLDSTDIEGDKFVFQIDENWQDYEGETLTYQCNATDKAGNWYVTDERTKEIIENKPPEFRELPEEVETRQYRKLTFNIEAYDSGGEELEFSTDFDELEIEKINESAAEANWKPGDKHVGKYEVNLTVTDGKNEVTEIININVDWVNAPPQIDEIPDIDAYLHEPFTLNLTATDPDNEIPGLEIGENYPGSDETYPQEGLFSADKNWIDREIFYRGVDLKSNESKGFLNVTPLKSHKGIHNVTFTVSDGQKTDSQNVLLRVGYCGDGICHEEYEDCETCPEDCGVCEEETDEDEMAIMIPSRNCLYTNVTATVYELYERTTCPEGGEVINGKEVCEPIDGATITVYRLEDDEWEEVEEYLTGGEGKVSFILQESGQYRLSGEYPGFKGDTTSLQVHECIDVPVELPEEEDNDEDEEEPEEEDEEEPEEEDDPEEDIPGEVENGNDNGGKIDEAPLILIILYYVIIPIIFASLLVAVFIYYEKEKNRKPWLLKFRIWKIKKEKQIKQFFKRLISKA